VLNPVLPRSVCNESRPSSLVPRPSSLVPLVAFVLAAACEGGDVYSNLTAAGGGTTCATATWDAASTVEVLSAKALVPNPTSGSSSGVFSATATIPGGKTASKEQNWNYPPLSLKLNAKALHGTAHSDYVPNDPAVGTLPGVEAKTDATAAASGNIAYTGLGMTIACNPKATTTANYAANIQCIPGGDPVPAPIFMANIRLKVAGNKPTVPAPPAITTDGHPSSYATASASAGATSAALSHGFRSPFYGQYLNGTPYTTPAQWAALNLKLGGGAYRTTVGEGPWVTGDIGVAYPTSADKSVQVVVRFFPELNTFQLKSNSTGSGNHMWDLNTAPQGFESNADGTSHAKIRAWRAPGLNQNSVDLEDDHVYFYGGGGIVLKSW
jgi:hypothetical protein